MAVLISSYPAGACLSSTIVLYMSTADPKGKDHQLEGKYSGCQLQGIHLLAVQLLLHRKLFKVAKVKSVPLFFGPDCLAFRP